MPVVGTPFMASGDVEVGCDLIRQPFGLPPSPKGEGYDTDCRVPPKAFPFRGRCPRRGRMRSKPISISPGDEGIAPTTGMYAAAGALPSPKASERSED